MNVVIIVAKQNITKFEIAKIEVIYVQYSKIGNLRGITIQYIT